MTSTIIENLNTFLHHINIPLEFWEAGFKTFTFTDLTSVTVALSGTKKQMQPEEFHSFLDTAYKKPVRFLFSGSQGAGKTHLAVAIQKNLLWYMDLKEGQKKTYKPKDQNIIYTSGFDTLFISQLRLSDAIRKLRGYSTEDIQDSAIFNRCSSIRHLLIDDLGEGDFEPRVTDGMRRLLKMRIHNKLLTDYTSNYNVGELVDLLGSHIVDRILGECYFITLVGDSHRQKEIPFNDQF